MIEADKDGERITMGETIEVLVRISKKDFEELQNNYVWWGKHGEYIKNGTVRQNGYWAELQTPIKGWYGEASYKTEYQCSICGRVVGLYERSKYCPDCGAKMRLSEHDCEHCNRKYGTLGCCSTVSNKWIYSCEEGHREYEETHREIKDG